MPGKMCLLRSGEYRARLGLVLLCEILVLVLVALCIAAVHELG